MQNLEDRFAKIRMREQLNHLFAKKLILEMKATFALNQFGKNNPATETTELANQCKDKSYKERAKIQKKKFSKLFHNKKEGKIHTQKKQPAIEMKSVMNLSSIPLTEQQMKILSLGFKFRPTLRKIPIQEYIVAAEAYATTSKMDGELKMKFLRTMQQGLQKTIEKTKWKPVKLNLTREDWQTISEMKNWTDRRIIQDDKNDITIVIDEGKFLENCTAE